MPRIGEMKLGIALRTMGEPSRPKTLLACARAAEDAGLDEIWVQDHIAIPPDDAEGSDGRYLDPLASLAFLAAATHRIALGTGVMVLPYRPALPTAKWIATIQELSGGRMLLGVGVGWMKPEFRALGVDRRQRGALTDDVLHLLHRCFDGANDLVECNGQAFLFRPNPPRPPIFVGGGPTHAFERVLRFGDGWMPMGSDPEKLAPSIADLRERANARGRAIPEVVALGGLPDDATRAAEQLNSLEEIGVTRFVCGGRYREPASFARILDSIVRARDSA